LYPSTLLHGVITQKTITWILTAMKFSRLWQDTQVQGPITFQSDLKNILYLTRMHVCHSFYEIKWSLNLFCTCHKIKYWETYSKVLHFMKDFELVYWKLFRQV
jgi:hypothetical protein